MKPEEAAKRIIVALDSDDHVTIVGAAEKVGAHIGMAKIGLEAFTAFGPRIVHDVHAAGCSVFLDLKFKDIPSTVAAAVRNATHLGVSLMNMHVDAGPEAMRAAVAARDAAWAIHEKKGKQPKPLILGVTVLTSLSHKDLVATGSQPKTDVLFGSAELVAEAVADAENRAVKDMVRKRALLAQACGLDGAISSPQEIALIREACGEGFLIVTPGVRPAWAAANDQKRVMTPAEAIQAGADYLVIGRPITKPPPVVGSPELAVKLIVKEICGTAEVADAG